MPDKIIRFVIQQQHAHLLHTHKTPYKYPRGAREHDKRLLEGRTHDVFFHKVGIALRGIAAPSENREKVREHKTLSIGGR
jgi:aromatic ring-opening dioxygenase LigB subunit